MAQPSQPRDRGDFQIAIICALPLEADAVEAQFDKSWGEDGEIYGKAPGDPNLYTTGVIGRHNVVLAQLPGMGKCNAGNAAAGFRSSFRGIKLALVVGICGGAPYTPKREEILLGDVIISTGIIQYDLGRRYPNKFLIKHGLYDDPSKPNPEIRILLGRLMRPSIHKRLTANTSHCLIKLQETRGDEVPRYPGMDADKLFKPPYRHKHHDNPECTLCFKCEKREDDVCEAALSSFCLELKCNENELVTRNRLSKSIETSSAQNPMIHFGLIASADTVMKSPEDRDEIAVKEHVIAFEMEGAGVWEVFPSVMIKGVCDYADSHKNKIWQDYAATTAAACMKALLKEWISEDIPARPIAPVSE
jgi:nucleoside phosphorylase